MHRAANGRRPVRTPVTIQRAHRVFISSVVLMVTLAFPLLAADNRAPVHGLWVWETLTLLTAPRSTETLLDFCRSNAISEVYVSVSKLKDRSAETQFADLIAQMHQGNIRVEALIGSTNADEPGPAREKLLEEVREVLEFGQPPRTDGFDGIHLDIEPQQRPENHGPQNLGFLPGLVETYRAVRQIAEPARLPIDADIPVKVLNTDPAQRQLLLSALPRFTLMLYELSNPADGESPDEKVQKLRAAGMRWLQTAYKGLDSPDLGQMSIGLRTPDYGNLLPRMLQTLDEANGANPHYLGWARHSYNDYLKSAE